MRVYFLLLFITLITFGCRITKPKIVTQGVTVDIKTANPKFISSTDFVIEGKRAEIREDYAEAERMYLRSLESNPQNHAACFLLSQLYSRKNNEKAILYCKRAVDLSPTTIEYHQQLATLCNKSRKYDLAAQEFEKIIKIEPNQQQHYFDYANFYIYIEKYDKAIDVYNQFTEKFGYEEGVVLQRKQIYLKQNKLTKAFSEIELLIANNPSNIDYLGMAAELSLATSNQKQAQVYCEKILELEPNEGRVHLVLSEIYESENKKDLAYSEKVLAFKSPNLDIDSKVKVLSKMGESIQQDSNQRINYFNLINITVETHPKEAKAYALQGDYYASQFKYIEARKSFQKILLLDSSKFLIWKQLILFDKEFGDYSAMNNESGRALRMFPMQSELYYFNALANFKMGNYDTALDILETGKSFCYSPMQQTEFQLVSSEIQLEKGNIQLAERYIKSLDENATKNPNLFRVKAKLAQKQGAEFEKIDQLYNQAISVQPSDIDTYIEYAEFLRKHNFSEKSISILKTVDSEKNFRVDYYLILNQFYLLLNNTVEAQKAYIKAVKCGALPK